MNPLTAFYYGYTKGFSGYKDQEIKENRQGLVLTELRIKEIKVLNQIKLKTLELELKALMEQRLMEKD